MRVGTLFYEDIDHTDNFKVQLAHNPVTNEYTMELSHPSLGKYNVKGKRHGNFIVMRGDRSVFNLYNVEEDVYFGEWHYQEKLGRNEVSLVKLELDEINDES